MRYTRGCGYFIFEWCIAMAIHRLDLVVFSWSFVMTEIAGLD
jgi:hypothetical protein